VHQVGFSLHDVIFITSIEQAMSIGILAVHNLFIFYRNSRFLWR